jgi:hypothetical protein
MIHRDHGSLVRLAGYPSPIRWFRSLGDFTPAKPAALCRRPNFTPLTLNNDVLYPQILTETLNYPYQRIDVDSEGETYILTVSNIAAVAEHSVSPSPMLQNTSTDETSLMMPT